MIVPVCERGLSKPPVFTPPFKQMRCFRPPRGSGPCALRRTPQVGDCCPLLRLRSGNLLEAVPALCPGSPQRSRGSKLQIKTI